MSNQVYIKGGKKVCRPIESRADYMKACNSTRNIDYWKKYRETGDEKYKRALEQFAYNCQTKEGEPLKGNETVSPFFFYDIDCGNQEECRRIMKELVERKDELGLVEVSESASYGVHAVARRVPGTTILENQVCLSIATRTEMDTNNKENNRVVFHGPIDPETTPLLDDALFTERLTDEEAAEEYKRLKERERNGQEQVPAGAHKANKHYRPWEDSPSAQGIAGQARNEGTGDNEGTVAPLHRCSSETPNSQPQTEQLQTNNSTLSTDSKLSTLNSKLKTPTGRTKFIAQGVMKEKNLKPKDFIDEGGRHTTVKIFLSGATQLLKKEETNGILAELMPEHWADENIQQLVDDFYKNYTNPSQKLYKYQEELFTQSQRLNELSVRSEELGVRREEL